MVTTHNGQPTGNHRIAAPFPKMGVPNVQHRTNFAMRAATWRIWQKMSTRFLLHTT